MIKKKIDSGEHIRLWTAGGVVGVIIVDFEVVVVASERLNATHISRKLNIDTITRDLSISERN